MGRKKKEETVPIEVIIETFNEWYAYHGFPSKINFSSIERYAKEKGVNITRTTLSRNVELQKHIKECCNEDRNGIGCDVYKPLDIQLILDRSFTKLKMKTLLKQLDNKIRGMYERNSVLSNIIREKNEIISRKEEEIYHLSQEIEKLKVTIQKKDERVKELKGGENELRRVKQRLKQEEMKNVEWYYNKPEKLNKENVISVTADSSFDETEHEIAKSRLSLVRDQFEKNE